jgi:muramidase (phage lysozyme)
MDIWRSVAEGKEQAKAIDSLAAADAKLVPAPLGFRKATVVKSGRIEKQPDSLAPYQRALLDVIAAGEGGEYDLMFGGRRFIDYSDHPRNPARIGKGKHAGDISTAAGRYQMTAPTWDDYARKLNLRDFSPFNQDLAAWSLAKDRFRRATKGGDLDSALRSVRPDEIKASGRNLATTWTSLPGGSEQRLTEDDFLHRYTMNFLEHDGRMPAPQARPAPFEERFSDNAEDHSQGPLAKALAARAEQLRRDEASQLRVGSGNQRVRGSDSSLPSADSNELQFWDRLFRTRGSLKDALKNWLD